MNILLMYIEQYFKTDLGFITGDPCTVQKKVSFFKRGHRSHIQVSWTLTIISASIRIVCWAASWHVSIDLSWQFHTIPFEAEKSIIEVAKKIGEHLFV